MKYEQPLGITDPNASYIDGNPNTGTKGSAVPAASIEFPQREIVNFITKSALTPSDSDLFQLAKAVQAGLVNYGTDQGVPNQIAITPVVPISAYALGQRFVIKVMHGNTSQVTVNINGIGAAPLIHIDQTPMNPYELIIGQLIEIAYDGANFQAIGGVGIGGAVLMTAPQTLYVNTTTGSDTLYDGTAAAVSGTSGPFKTIQKALVTMTKYNLGGWNFTISVADGTYALTDPLSLPRPNGSGTVILQGNSTNPANCALFNTNTGAAVYGWNGGNYQLNGFSYRATAPRPGDAGHGIWVQGATNLTVGNSVYHSIPVGAAHLISGPSSFMFVYGNQTIDGGGGFHHYGYANGVIYNNYPSPNQPVLNIAGPVTFAAFSYATNGGQVRETWETITGAGNVTGPKYAAQSNGVIDSTGRGASYLPGTVAGTLSTGGQYL